MLMISLTKLEKKELHRLAHSMLRECLKLRCVNYDEDTPLARGRKGKPFLAERPDIHFNLSHSKGIAACIVSEHECGIDCEEVREYRPAVVKRAFSESERIMIEEAPPEERDLLFFRLWTLKESYVKAIGTGISYPLNTLEFSFEGDSIISSQTDCRFRQIIIDGGKYAVAICEKMSSAT